MFPCTPLVYSLDALCSFLIYILFFTDKKKNIGVGRFLERKALDAEGTAGGILLFRDKRRLSLVESEYGSFLVSYLFRMVEMIFS